MTIITTAKELGTNCWLSYRFLGGECKRVEACKYPEKKECRASLKVSGTKWVFASGYDNGIEYHI